MGCTQSKIENEEAVSRCKDRKLFMKEAVSFRNAFAAAHSSYAIYLKNTGAALSDYAQGEVASHRPQLAQALLQPNLVAGATFDSSFPPPPPPLPNFPAAPLQRAASMPEIKPDPKARSKPKPMIIEEEDEDEEMENSESLRVRTRSKSNRGVVQNNEEEEEEEDEFPDGQPPPSPSPPPPRSVESQTVPPLPLHHDSPYDYFFSVDMPAPSLAVPAEPSLGKEEIPKKVFDERPKRVERVEEPVVELKRSPKLEEEVVVTVPAPPPPVVVVEPAGKTVKKVVKPGGPKVVVNLLEVFAKIDDHFLKASESAHEVSKMLEATRLHYHSNFADNRGHIDHSARVMRVITWNRSFKGIPNFDDGGKDDFDSEEHETHATVLDKLLAWEKKLYDEVKAGELMKFEYQKKVASLNKLKKRSTNSEALEKSKAAVSHLHTRYIVDMQSMDSTVSEINSLRDDQLYPKLVQLVAGMATMWEAMRYHHESQSKIATALRSFDISQCPKYTTDHHHERTFQLWYVVQEWHSQFVKLVSNQKDYVKALRNWLKLNLIPIESNLKEKVSSPPRIQNPPIQGLLLEWNDHLEKLPDDVARTAIHNFAGVIHTIMLKQEEEMKMKEKCEDSRKELDRKQRQFEDWYHKYMNKNIPDEADQERPESIARSDVVAEKQFNVETVKKRLEDEDEAYARLCLQVREKSITSLKTGLPELFRALSDFAFSCSEMYKHLRSRSAHHQSESSARQ
ncbi:nitrate regulatory gene2 protein-like [Rosa rugosa]|uniref:nitrate regulatory gene2 protein-like n=1 Tax=Rosa rugosa TaxID=74645 RepID=UPI002B404EFB|nr:nitrate regulatory gene2 protein-like [Rosa rugosa]